MKPDKERLFLSVQQVSDETGISRSTIYRLIERGEIPSCKIGASVLIPRQWLTELASKALNGSQPERIDLSAIRHNKRRKTG